MSENPNVCGRIIAILQAFSEGHTTLSLKQVAERCELAPSTAHRLLEQLVNEGMIDRAPVRRYCIGSELIRISTMVKTKVRLVEIAKPIMSMLVQNLQLTCFLSLYVPARICRIPVATLEPENRQMRRMRLAEHQSLVWGAGGRSILAHLDRDDVLTALATAPRCPINGKAPPSRAKLLRDLALVRERGYEVARGELLSPYTVAAGAPIFGPEGKVVANLSITTVAERWTSEYERRAIALLLNGTSQLSVLLGCPTTNHRRKLAS
jgi:DNA-binding IclR family transcriptional regulator